MQLSVHGVRRSPSWTKLASNAQAGDTTIAVEGSSHPNWRPGDRIVIAPSGWNPEEAEIRTIMAISGGIVTQCHRSMLWHH